MLITNIKSIITYSSLRVLTQSLKTEHFSPAGRIGAQVLIVREK